MSTQASHPGRLQATLERHALALDVVLTLGMLVVCVPAGLIQGGVLRPLASFVLVAPLALRRRWPVGVFALLAAVAFVQWLAGAQLLADVALLVALYTVAAHASRRSLVAAFAVLQVGIVLASVHWAGHGAFWFATAFLTSLALAAAVLGRNQRTRRRYLASLEDRAARLERERDQQGQLAAAAERARIAREMHDIVAHNLTVMTALADGARFAARADPDRAAGAMATVSATGRQALSEMRRLLGVLREDDGEGDGATRAPQPGIAQLDGLLDQVRAAGLPVVLQVSGRPSAALGAGAELTVFRVVQEALTNTLKHAGPGARATVSLRCADDAVEVEVTDDGTAAAGDAGGSGSGLAGMRERAAVFGGAVEAGPRAEGGWRVRVRLAATTVGEAPPVAVQGGSAATTVDAAPTVPTTDEQDEAA